MIRSDLGLDYPSGSERVSHRDDPTSPRASAWCCWGLGIRQDQPAEPAGRVGTPSRTLRVGGLDLVGASDLERPYRNHGRLLFQSFHLMVAVRPGKRDPPSISGRHPGPRAGTGPSASPAGRPGELCHRPSSASPEVSASGGVAGLICQPDTAGDEPVGHLDDATAESVTELLIEPTSRADHGGHRP